MNDQTHLHVTSNDFLMFGPQHGFLLDRSGTEHPSSMQCLNARTMQLPDNGTHFGFVYDGELRFAAYGSEFKLSPGMFFAIPGAVELAATGLVLLITRHDFYGMFQVGGAIEDKGRLRYIDGCTDSLLIAPPLRGDACLNLLHFPPGIDQTAHTHPSDRLGIIARGNGLCRTPDGTHELRPGDIFCIPSDTLHSFATQSSDMSVIAYHPDSDFGPTHEEHPMINRTIVDGVSASRLSAIQTSEITP